MQDIGHALAFMAHPADIEFLCAGVLLRLRERGYQVHLATMTAGDGGSTELGPEELTRKRLLEAEASARRLGATYLCAGEKDFTVCYRPETIRKAVEIVRQSRASIVFTHPPADYLQDHAMTSQLVTHACLGARVRNVKTDALPAAPPLRGVPHLYFVSPLEGRDVAGLEVAMEFGIDIGSVSAEKEEMLRCHASQGRGRMEHAPGEDLIEAGRAWCCRLGAPLGMACAEGYRQHRGPAYPQDNLLLDTLG